MLNLVPAEWNPTIIGVQEGAPAAMLEIFLSRPDVVAELQLLETPLLNRTGVMVLGWPEKIEDDPQCRVVTRKGTRCRNPIFYGQVHWWWPSTASSTLTEDHLEECFVSQEDYDTLMAGLCPFHVWKETGGGS